VLDGGINRERLGDFLRGRLGRLRHVEGFGFSKAAVAAELSISGTAVHRQLGLVQSPRYERTAAGSQVEACAGAIWAMLDRGPKVPATVIAQRFRLKGFTRSLTIPKNHLRRVCSILAARTSGHPRGVGLVSCLLFSAGFPDGSAEPDGWPRSARRWLAGFVGRPRKWSRSTTR
jgi:hypothetical protein